MMKLLYITIATLSLSIMTLTQAWACEPNTKCPAKKLLPELEDAYNKCNDAVKDSCAEFIATFNELTVRSDCQRSFDTYPVPAIWLASIEAFEKYLDLIHTLAMSTDEPRQEKWTVHHRGPAAEFYATHNFRNVLDGEYMSMYYNESMKLELEMAGELDGEN